MLENEIFLISTKAGAGGHYFVLEDIKWLIKRGFIIHLVSEARRPPLNEIKLHTFRKFGLPKSRYLKRLLNWIHEPRDILTTIYISRLASYIEETQKKFNFPFIHAHFALPEGTASVLASHKPVLVTVHGYDVQVHESVGYGIRLRKFGDEAVKWTLERASLIMVANQYMREVVKNIVDNQKIEIVTNAVDVQKFRPNVSCNIELPQKYIFCLKQHTSVSGIDVLIKAFNKIKKIFPNLKLLIGGSGPKTKYYIKLANKLGINKSIRFLGYIEHDKLPCYYARASMVVVPSLIEAFGLSATEAMACGRPVVVSDVGGLREQVIHGVNGLRFPPGDVNALAEAIETLLRDPDLAEKMGKIGREIAIQNYSMEKRIDRLIKIYRRFTS